MYIKDLTDGTVRKYGSDRHDSLVISEDGRTLSYENLQNGDGSLYGDYRFCDKEGKIPAETEYNYREEYFNIGGWEEPRFLAHSDGSIEQINEPKWIPVSERLPEEGQSVLFCDIYDDIMVGFHFNDRPRTHFAQDGTCEDMKNVRAWMPLPEPYEAESEGRNDR